jgi:hypothetical protein
MTIRKVTIEITLPSGHREALSEEQVAALIGQLASASPTVSGVDRDIIAAACKACKTVPALVFSKQRDERNVFARWLVWHYLYVKQGLTTGQIAAIFKQERSTVSFGIGRLQDTDQHGKQWQKLALNEFRKDTQTT